LNRTLLSPVAIGNIAIGHALSRTCPCLRKTLGYRYYGVIDVRRWANEHVIKLNWGKPIEPIRLPALLSFVRGSHGTPERSDPQIGFESF
jgi:hypothetical protein